MNALLSSEHAGAEGTGGSGHFARVLMFWLAVAAAAFVISMSVSGKVSEVGLVWGWPGEFLLPIRLQSVIAAAIVGFSLAAAGVTLQALLRNPLADPFVLGISSGSTVGVMAWMLMGELLLPNVTQGAAYIFLTVGRSVPSVLGAIITCLLVFSLARGRGTGMQPVTLLLVGVVISSINGALLMVLNSLAPHGLRADLATYLLGSINDNDLSTIILWSAFAAMMAGYIPTLLSAAALNIGTLSDTEASSLGIHVQRLRTLTFLCASIMTGAAILLSGPIGFVGLVCPHICRRLKWVGGADHRTLLISAPLCGAAFLMLANTAVRVGTTLKMGQFPVGVVTALIGGPFFLFLLRRSAR